MIATVHIGNVELAELLRAYCESHGFTYVEHGITEDYLIDLKIDIPSRPVVYAAASPAPTSSPPEKRYVQPPEESTQLSLADLMSPSGEAPVPRGANASSSSVEADHELADLFRAQLKTDF